MRVFVCATCTYPSRFVDACDNPGCMANPKANHAVLRAMQEKEAKERAEREERDAARKRLRRQGFTTAF